MSLRHRAIAMIFLNSVLEIYAVCLPLSILYLVYATCHCLMITPRIVSVNSSVCRTIPFWSRCSVQSKTIGEPGYLGLNVYLTVEIKVILINCKHIIVQII